MSQPFCPTTRHRAFTFVEIAVVVSVLVVLALALYPVAQRARENSLGGGCQSNLRQILLATKMYCQDSAGRFPLLNFGQQKTTTPPTSGIVNSLFPYTRSLQVFWCFDGPNLVRGNSDYAYNCVSLQGQLEAHFRHSANTVAFCESVELPGSLASATAPVITNRHLEGSNYAFVDGHVKWLQSNKAPTPTNVVATRSNFTFGK